MPKSLDPARASTAPETDVIRAIFEGLTELDPKTLKAKPGVALEWSVSEDGKTWTFKLRENAKWTNGKPVTANDFVRSWQRLNKMGEQAAHRNLLQNFALVSGIPKVDDPAEPEDFVESSQPDKEGNEAPSDLSLPATPKEQNERPKTILSINAPDQRTVVASLISPDPQFPELVSHPIFRPIYGRPEAFEKQKLDTKVVTNGAFRIADISADGITLERSKTYWDHENVKLDVVRFISNAKPNEALEAYRTGAIDAVTNTEFSPLAQKVFSPYGDFRKNAFAALNFYEINYQRAPFNDRRIREALAISIERERLMTAEFEATAQPALSYLPFAASTQEKLIQDKERARDLLEQAGFENGRGFPVIKLTVNRNETQLRVARAVAKMWKENLNLDTEVIAKESSEIAEVRSKADFDIIRRGVVLPVPDEYVCMSAILGQEREEMPQSGSDPFLSTQTNTNSNSIERTNEMRSTSNSNSIVQGSAQFYEILNEADALYQLRVIPLYFPTSLALVKPFVIGFESNSLDSANLQDISINSEWTPDQK
ncbi:MAG: peptide ABC transporter substrate-binding protein [Pyrinomonadaceae bacterium]